MQQVEHEAFHKVSSEHFPILSRLQCLAVRATSSGDSRPSSIRSLGRRSIESSMMKAAILLELQGQALAHSSNQVNVHPFSLLQRGVLQQNEL